MSANRQRTRHAPQKRRGGATWVWMAVVGVIVVGSVALIAVSAMGNSKASATEISKKVTVSGAKLTPIPDRDKTTGQAPADPEIGKQMPVLTGVNPQDKTVTIGKPGSPALVFVVAHWCPHCQREIPKIKQYQDQGLLKGVNLEILSTSQDDLKTNWPPSTWLADKGPKAVVLSDDANLTGAEALGVAGFPTIIAVDSSGKIVGRTSGEQPQANIEALANAARTGKPVNLNQSSQASPANP